MIVQSLVKALVSSIFSRPHLRLRPSFFEGCRCFLKSIRQSVASEIGVKDLMGESLILNAEAAVAPSSSSSSSSRRSMTSLTGEHRSRHVKNRKWMVLLVNKHKPKLLIDYRGIVKVIFHAKTQKMLF